MPWKYFFRRRSAYNWSKHASVCATARHTLFTCWWNKDRQPKMEMRLRPRQSSHEGENLDMVNSDFFVRGPQADICIGDIINLACSMWKANTWKATENCKKTLTRKSKKCLWWKFIQVPLFGYIWSILTKLSTHCYCFEFKAAPNLPLNRTSFFFVYD